MIEKFPNGAEYHIQNGKYHREDGPAIKYANGTKLWYINNKLHREDGPAIEYASGNKEWYLNGNSVSPKDLPCDYDYLKLKYLL